MFRKAFKWADENPTTLFLGLVALVALAFLQVGELRSRTVSEVSEQAPSSAFQTVTLTSNTCYAVDDKGWIACYSEGMPRAWDNFVDKMTCTLDAAGKPLVCSLSVRIHMKPVSCRELTSTLASCTFPKLP